jgi:Ca2+-binding EF-hand superfamily protein
MSESRILGAFSIYDIDDDGYITTEEMYFVVSSIFQRRGLKMDQTVSVESKVEEIFSRMDVVSLHILFSNYSILKFNFFRSFYYT